MGIHWTLFNDRDCTALTLGTGHWDSIFGGWTLGPCSRDAILDRLVASEAMRSWGDVRLGKWADTIATFLNGAEGRLVNDAGDVDDDGVGYRVVGYLKDVE